MRIAFTLMLLFVVTLTASADTGRRGRWRTAPARTWRVFDGYNVRQPGWESSYYTPYTTENTTGHTPTLGTPTPITGQWSPENTIPNTTWTDGATTPTQTQTPNAYTPPTTTQYFSPIPNVQSELVPSPTGQQTTPTQNDTTRSTNRRPSSSASFQRETPQTNYWNTLNGGSK